MNLKLVFALTAVLGSTPVVVAQHSFRPDAETVSAWTSGWLDTAQDEQAAPRPRFQCMTIRPVALGRAGPVNSAATATSIWGKGAGALTQGGNVTCVES
jgi:hypothetical protein